ncbi:hypothetical protein [Heyndrickxia acidicola]|uniref:Uncharacterized protein n=1 Tax=Heyndrickxia acidicola TaxID=209389 RepID=A0ABU6MHU5_9BACI|nr:hypothetical protein [Heyndrickxia acidicola]MED1204252.1 hypothetical protein [Heyndrickxia acidicola]
MIYIYILLGIHLLLMLIMAAELISTKKEIIELKNQIRNYFENRR